MSNPFFSIIIPVYNPNIDQFNHMVKSLENQMFIEPEDFEIIFVDDCSPSKEFQKSLSNFNLPYILLQTEENSGQGIAREVGTRKAKGEWITYLDQDDTLTDTALYSAKEIINESGCEFLLDTKVIIADDYNWVETQMFHIFNTDDVLHAKFINRKELQRRGIHFHSSLRTAEDTYFYNLCIVLALWECNNNGRDKYYVKSDIATYVWYLWNDSTSHKIENNIDYFEANFRDYVTACIDSTDCLVNMLRTTIMIKPRIISALINFYFHYELYCFRGKSWDHVPKEMMCHIHRYFDYVKQYDMSKEDIKQIIFEKASDIYYDLYGIISSRQEPFIPEHTIYEFIDMI